MNRRILIGIALAFAALAPTFMYPLFLMKLLCFALFASAFNLLAGYTGLLSFGHAAFFGGAGYVTGLALKNAGLPVEVSLLLGVLYSAFLGYLIGFLSIRRQGIYFSMITLSLAQMLYFVYMQAPLTGGEDGLQAVPRGKLLGIVDLSSDLTLYYFVLLVTAAAFLIIYRAIHSPFGQVLQSIQENEARAVSLGYEADRIKLLSFVLSAALSGLAGALKTVVFGFQTLVDVHWSTSGTVILMTLVGGLGTYFGPAVGALIVVSLDNKLGEIGAFLVKATGIEWFNRLGESVGMFSGLIFVACVLAFRRGVVGEIGDLLRQFRKRTSTAASPRATTTVPDTPTNERLMADVSCRTEKHQVVHPVVKRS